MAETLLLAAVVVAGFVVMVVLDVHGKARAFGHGDSEPAVRPPEAVTSVEHPPPHFDQRDPHTRRRGKSR